MSVAAIVATIYGVVNPKTRPPIPPWQLRQTDAEVFISAEVAGISEVRGVIAKIDRFSLRGCEAFDIEILRMPDADVILDRNLKQRTPVPAAGKSVRIAVPKKAKTTWISGKWCVIIDHQAGDVTITEDS